MRPEEYEVMFGAEECHWWYLGMARITCELLDHAVDRGRELSILDAGCGSGAAMEYLARYGRVVGFDASAQALDFSRRRGHRRLARASVMGLPFQDGIFDLIVSFDVICQANVDAAQALAEFARVLKPGGQVLLRLPAYRWMKGRHDVAVAIERRFRRSEIGALLRSVGLGPEKLSYANTLLFPIALAKRWLERVWPWPQSGSDLTIDPGPVNGLLRAVLSAEAPLVRSCGLPFGLSVVALARKLGRISEPRG